MKIAILVDALAVGGAERQAIVCTAELRKLGHAADLVYYRPKVEYTEMLRRLSVEPVFVHGGGFAATCSHLQTFLKERSYEVVHGFKMAAEIYAAVAGTWAGVPRRFGSFRSVYDLRWKYRLLHHAADKFLHGWIVNSAAAADSMSRLARIRRSRFQILQNGFSSEALDTLLSPAEAKAKLGLGTNLVVVTMVARLEKQKNHSMLIQVAKRVASIVPEARFLVVGKGTLERQLREEASRQGLRDVVLFLGQRTDIGDIIAATDISVLTSNCEGLPNVMIEAMAAGKPIVCTEYRGATEIMADGQNALLSACDDANGFAGQLLRLMRDAALRTRLGANARDYANRTFSPKAMARRLEHIYLKRTSEPGAVLTSPGTVCADAQAAQSAN